MYQDPVRVCLYRIEVKDLMRPRMSEHVLLEKMCGRMCEPSDSIVHGGLKECCCSCVCVCGSRLRTDVRSQLRSRKGACKEELPAACRVVQVKRSAGQAEPWTSEKEWTAVLKTASRRTEFELRCR